MEWRSHAACLDAPPGAMFPPNRTVRMTGDELRAVSEAEARAKEYCDRCPVAGPCLRLGLYEPDGVWGGMTQAERRVWRRRRPGSPMTINARHRRVQGERIASQLADLRGGLT